jgi:hypothetical protein
MRRVWPAHAARGEKKKALAELKRALTLGFADPARLAEEPEWQDLRERPELQAILEELRARR